MQHFVYKGVNANGNLVSDVVVAYSKDEALYKLMDSGIDIVSIKKYRSAKSTSKVKLNKRDTLAFFVHIAETAKAGIRTLNVLDLLIDLSSNKKLKQMGEFLKSKVQQGSSLSEAMKSSGSFGDTFPDLIFIAEKTNSLHVVGFMIVDYIKWLDDITRSMKGAILKPILSLIFILSLIIGMSVLVLPKLLDTLGQFSGGNVPPLTRSFITFTNFLREDWYLIPAFIIGIYAIVKIPKWCKFNSVLFVMDRLKLKLPLFGSLILKVDIARLSAFLAILIKSGYKANDAILEAPRVVQNMYMRSVVKSVGDAMVSGSSIHTAFSSFKIFPKFFISMIGIGEAVNEIESTILNIKESYDKEVKSTVEFVISGMKPIITILTGLLIGWMGMAVFSPMYQSVANLSTNLK